MSKRTEGTCEEGAPPLEKTKVQATTNVTDDAMAEAFPSRFSLSEIFQDLPIQNLGELFDFLDIRHATRLSRVNPTWEAALKKGPVRNHGTAVLHVPQSTVGDKPDKAFEKLCETLWMMTQYTRSWGRKINRTQLLEDELFSARPNSIKHLILIGNFSEAVAKCANEHEGSGNWEGHGAYGILDCPNTCMTVRLYYKLCSISSSLNEITLCQDEMYSFTFLHCKQMPESVKWVNFVNCTFTGHDCRFILSAEDEFVAAAALSALPVHYSEDGVLYVPRKGKEDGAWVQAYFGIVWHLEVFAPRVELDRSVDFDDGDQNCMCKKLDEKSHIWPYLEEQVQWLLTTLEGLEGAVLQSVKNTDEFWMDWRGESAFGDHKNCYRELDLTTKASCDGRKLQTIDLAFLGGLLVCMNKAKGIPGFQPPPFEFPNDFKYGRTMQ